MQSSPRRPEESRHARSRRCYAIADRRHSGTARRANRNRSHSLDYDKEVRRGR